MISWVCALSSALSVYFCGNRVLLGPVLGMLGFVPWTYLAYSTEQFGLIPLNCLLTFLHARAFWRWKKAGSAVW